MNQLINFNGTPVSIFNHNGKKWLSAEQIGLCLGYADGNARLGIMKIHERHGDEFTEADTCVVKLTTQGQARDVRVFSETGCNKLGFFSNTSKSKEFRHWAAQVLVGQVPASVPAVPPKKNGRISITRAVERQVFELFVDGLPQKQIARQLAISTATVNLLLRAQYRFAYGAGEAECSFDLIAEVAGMQFEAEQQRLIEMQERIAQRFLANSNNQELADLLDHFGQQLALPALNS